MRQKTIARRPQNMREKHFDILTLCNPNPPRIDYLDPKNGSPPNSQEKNSNQLLISQIPKNSLSF